MIGLVKKIFKLFFSTPQDLPDLVTEPYTSIPIKFTFHKDEIPSGWTESRINGQFKLIHKREKSSSVSIVSCAFNKYPKDLLQSYIQKVFFFDSMSMFGHGYAGTHSHDALMICNGGLGQGYSLFNLETTVHHEIASLLFFHNKAYLNLKKWMAHTATPYTSDNPVDVFNKNLIGKTSKKKLAEQGFLNDFASSNLRNDFVSHAENIFMGNPKYYTLIKKHPALEAKCRLTIMFFYLINEQFTPKYFDNLSTFKFSR